MEKAVFLRLLKFRQEDIKFLSDNWSPCKLQGFQYLQAGTVSKKNAFLQLYNGLNVSIYEPISVFFCAYKLSMYSIYF